METIFLHRTELLETHTPGIMHLGAVTRIATLEPAVKYRASWPNPRIYCVPPGRYPMRKNWSPRFGRLMYEIEGVAGHDGVLVHWGNFARQTTACTLTGLKHGTLNGLPAVLDSRKAYKIFEDYCDHFTALEIEITEPLGPC